MKTIFHLMYCPFTGLGLHNGYRGDTWLRNRIKIFLSFVLPSLMNQMEQNFTLWISFRPEDEGNPIIEQFIGLLHSMRDLKFVVTYGGICFWDDKYEDGVAADRLRQSLVLSLPEIAPLIGENDEVLMTIQPSDDMYMSYAVKEIQAKAMETEGKRVIGYREGYIMNYATKEVAEYARVNWTNDGISTYQTNTIPPFFTIVFPRAEFIDPDRHFDWIGPYKSHEYIADFFEYLLLPGRGFVVGTHGANISTTFNHRYKGRTMTEKEREVILIKTGTLFADPIKIKVKGRLVARAILNKMPFSEMIRALYHKLPPSLQKL